MIVVGKSGIHSNGVYVQRDIVSGTRIIEYVGKKITKRESEVIGDRVFTDAKNNPVRGMVYIFTLNKRHDIDGNVSWNPARFINHSCSPNCEAVNIRGHIWIVALRDIKACEELTYDYGYSIDDFEQHPCRCGSKNCVGYIVSRDEWRNLRYLLKKKAVASA